MAVEAAAASAALYAVQNYLAPSALNYMITSIESFLSGPKHSNKSVAKIKDDVARLVPREQIDFIQQLSGDVAALRAQSGALQKLFEQLSINTRQMNAIVYKIDCEIRDYEMPWYRRRYYGLWISPPNVDGLLDELTTQVNQFQQTYQLLVTWFPKLQPLYGEKQEKQAEKQTDSSDKKAESISSQTDSSDKQSTSDNQSENSTNALAQVQPEHLNLKTIAVKMQDFQVQVVSTKGLAQ